MLAVMSTLSSCAELLGEDSMGPDGSKPNVTVKKPTTNQVFTASQGLPVAVTIIDKDAIKQLHVYVAGGAGEAPIVDFSLMNRKTVIEMDTLVSLSKAKAGSYTLKITATDNRTNVTEKQVQFSVR